MGAVQAKGDFRQRWSEREMDGHLEGRCASWREARPFLRQMKLKSSLCFIAA